MKGSIFAAFAMSLGLFASITGTQTASAMVLPSVAASAKATVPASVTKVRFFGGRWGGGWRPGFRWRPGYGWVPWAVGGAVVAGAVAGAYAYGPYYYGPYAYPYYGPRPYYGPAPYYGPGPDYGPVK